jgi:glycogen debranching enzyme
VLSHDDATRAMSAPRTVDSGDGGETAPFYLPAQSSAATQRPRVLKRGSAFAVLDDFGNAQAMGPAAQGLFFEDTRYLAQLLLTIDGVRPLLLSSFVPEDDSVISADLSNPDLVGRDGIGLAKNTIHILSTTAVGDDVLFQRLVIRNFGQGVAHFRLEVHFGADFADIFEVRGIARARRGQMLPDEAVDDGVVLGYRGLDAIVRRTHLSFDPFPQMTSSRMAVWPLALAASGTCVIQISVRCERDGRPAPAQSMASCLEAASRHREERQTEVAKIFTSNERFNAWTNRSRADLEMLITQTPQGLYAYAGIPWFSTEFGRDGIITALLCLWVDPSLAAGTLRFLAATQATTHDPKADAEPGKILHETRRGEMAILGEVPFARYYGGVDSTPLFVVLAAAYFQRTADLGLILDIWPAIEAAVQWMLGNGRADGHGFLEYDRRSVNGLVNQGWKDSGDAIFHADGRLAEAPIALAEVQSYAYSAYQGAAGLAARLGKTPLAAKWVAAGVRLERTFESAFWLEDLGTYAIAIDAHHRPCRIATSNAGLVLMGGLATAEHAARVAQRLLSPAAFSLWGIRTVEETEIRYNPMSYHNGSVWPHDNAMIAMGFARYGLREPLLRVMSALFEASLFSADRRLPELFCGFERRPGSSPTAYPVACIPQAWSAATVFGLMGAVIGISFDPGARQIRFTRPALPAWMDECRISDLRLGDAEVDLQLSRRENDVALHVVRRSGDVEIVILN